MQTLARAIARILKNKGFAVFLAVISIISAYICFYQLGSGALENWDEAWYGEILRNMLRGHGLAVPYWNRTVLLDKPPLQMWLSIPFALLFGLNEFSVRVVSALSGFTALLLVSGYAYRKWGTVPAITAFLTLALNNTFIWRVRSGNIDALLTVLVLTVFLVVQMRGKHKYAILGLLFSLIYLAKASMVMYPFSIFVLSELIFEQKQLLKNIPQYLMMLAIAVALPALWLLAGSMQTGWSFAKYYLFHSDQGVAAASFRFFKLDYILYLYYSLQRRFAYLLVAGLVFCIAGIRRKEVFLFASFSTLLLVLLTFTERSNNWYLLPAMPFWSLTIGYGVSSIFRIIPQKKILTYPVTAFFLALVFFISFKTFTVNIMPIVQAAGPADQKNVGIELARLSRPGDTVIRTNDAYPTTVFYADRKILTYKPEITQAHATFIGSGRLKQCLKAKTCPLITGPAGDTGNLIRQLGPNYLFKEVYRSGDEVIMRLIQAY